MAAKRSRKRSSSTRSKGRTQGSLMPWYCIAALAVGGMATYDHWPSLRPKLIEGEHVAAASLASHMPAEKSKAAMPSAFRSHPSSSMPVPPASIPAASTAAPVIPVSAPRPALAPAPTTASESFGFCGDGPHFNCVVDGDTFWVRGSKIRIADIEAPPVDASACEQAKTRGTAAKLRLLALLNQGAFALQANMSEPDKDGTKLRTLYRQGHSIGMQMISEGLAQPAGSHRAWCT
jgi:endonuclease YncB( thermonuclease family)